MGMVSFNRARQRAAEAAEQAAADTPHNPDDEPKRTDEGSGQEDPGQDRPGEADAEAATTEAAAAEEPAVKKRRKGE